MTTDIMTIREVSEYLEIAEKTAYRLAADGELPGLKIGGSWWFRRNEIDRLINKKQGDADEQFVFRRADSQLAL